MIFFTIIGVSTCLVILGVALILTITAINKAIAGHLRKIKIKHRFDKPPTAECYCIDCIHREKDGLCRDRDQYMADERFCWAASPKLKTDITTEEK